MSNDKNHIEKFERYLKGQMSPEEAHAFERDILDDPFTQEAIEGMESQDPKVIFRDLQDLKKHISKKKNKGPVWFRIAAMIAMLIVGSLAVFYLFVDIQDPQLAQSSNTVSDKIIDSIELSQEEVSEETMEEVSEEIKAEFDTDGVKVEDEDEEVVDNMLAGIEPEQIVSDYRQKKLSISDNLKDAAGIEGKGNSIELAEASIKIKPAEDQLIVLEHEVPVPEQTFDDQRESVSKKSRARITAARAVTGIESSSEVITGTVVDNLGEPLPGVNVIIKGTTTSTTTDLEGRYTLPKSVDMTLIFYFLGFDSLERNVKDQSILDITMTGTISLQEVVRIATELGKKNRGLEDAITEPSNATPPKPSIGDSLYRQYLKREMVYPEAAMQNEIEGTVVLVLTISPSGDIGKIAIKKSLGFGCDQEAIRLVKEGPEWNAASRSGIKVDDKVTVEVKFNMD